MGITKNNTCRICDNKPVLVFSLDKQPPANAFITEDEIDREHFYPLDVYYCKKCSLVQLVDIVDPEELFINYAYMTSTSTTMVRHLDELANEINKEFDVQNVVVVDIGGNDGTLAHSFKKLGATAINVEPATNLAKLSSAKGIITINDFMNYNVAEHIVQEHGHAKVVTATNVFAHVNDLTQLVESIKHVLSSNGILVFEVPHLLNLIIHNEFDTIYHEHLSYFSVKPLQYLFDKFNMTLFRIKEVQVHGGSIRVFVSKSTREIESSVNEIIKKEEANALYAINTFMQFGNKIQKIKGDLKDLLNYIKNNKLRIVGYGAAAKGNVLLNYCKIGTDVLDYIVDNTPFKQGKLSPGMHIPIVHPNVFKNDTPDYVLILPWNWADEIISKEKEYKGMWIIPIPQPVVRMNYPKGVRIRPLTVHEDTRGLFVELYRTDWKEFIPEDIKQVNLSISKPNVCRAWHRHKRRQIDYIMVLKGKMKIMVMYRGKKYEITPDKYQLIRVPGHYWHGTKNVGDDDAMVLYFVTKLYDYNSPDEERMEYEEK